MTDREDQPGETRQFLRMFGDDIADEAKYVGLFLLVMVPAGLVGFLVADGAGAFIGAIAGAGLVVAWIIVSVAWELVTAVRRRGAGDRDRP